MMTQGRRLFFFTRCYSPLVLQGGSGSTAFSPDAGPARRFQDIWREGMLEMPRDLWCWGHTGSGPRAHTEIPIIL